MKAFKGIAAGVAVAILIITTVAIVSVYQITRATTSGYKALSEYSVQSQKPEFKVLSIDLNGTSYVVSIVNQGPVGALVRSLSFYVINSTGVPISVDTYTVNTYVPVGGSVNVSLSVNQITRYLSIDAPLRVLVETDKGPVLIGYDASSKLRINVMLPQGMTLSNVKTLSLNISCPINVATTPPQKINVRISNDGSPARIPKNVNMFTYNNLVSFSVKVLSLSPCLVELETTFNNFKTIGTNWTLASSTIPVYAKLAQVTLSFSAVADTSGSSSIEMIIPDAAIATQSTESPNIIALSTRLSPSPPAARVLRCG